MYSPSIESVSVAYSAESNEDGGLACSDLTESETSCEIMITKPDSYTLTVQLINAVGTTTASTSVSGMYSSLYIVPVLLLTMNSHAVVILFYSRIIGYTNASPRITGPFFYKCFIIHCH